MPLYDFACQCGETTEYRAGVEVDSIPCPNCRRKAKRVGVYSNQYMQAQTGPVGGKKNETPRDEVRLGRDVAEYGEAVAELGHLYAKEDEAAGRTLPRPDLLKVAKKRLRSANIPVQ